MMEAWPTVAWVLIMTNIADWQKTVQSRDFTLTDIILLHPSSRGKNYYLHNVCFEYKNTNSIPRCLCFRHVTHCWYPVLCCRHSISMQFSDTAQNCRLIIKDRVLSQLLSPNLWLNYLKMVGLSSLLGTSTEVIPKKLPDTWYQMENHKRRAE